MTKIHIPLFLAGLILTIVVPGNSALQQTRPGSMTRHKPARTRVQVQRTIVVNKADNLLKLFVTGQPCRYWRVATGKYHCTPEGKFIVIEKSIVSRSGHNPLGTRWLGLNTLGRRHLLRVGIHGTNDPQSIGHWASLSCIRMHNSDVNYLYELVPIGTTVRVVNFPPDQPLTLLARQKQTKRWVSATLTSLNN